MNDDGDHRQPYLSNNSEYYYSNSIPLHPRPASFAGPPRGSGSRPSAYDNNDEEQGGGGGRGDGYQRHQQQRASSSSSSSSSPYYDPTSNYHAAGLAYDDDDRNGDDAATSGLATTTRMRRASEEEQQQQPSSSDIYDNHHHSTTSSSSHNAAGRGAGQRPARSTTTTATKVNDPSTAAHAGASSGSADVGSDNRARGASSNSTSTTIRSGPRRTRSAERDVGSASASGAGGAVRSIHDNWLSPTTMATTNSNNISDSASTSSGGRHATEGSSKPSSSTANAGSEGHRQQQQSRRLTSGVGPRQQQQHAMTMDGNANRLEESNTNGSPQATTTTRSRQSQTCSKCHLQMSGSFVRALGTVFHLDCFRCQDCNKIVASKFFPIDGPDSQQYPLCETDYFRRLSLICSKCGMALRGSYITALDMKFHIEHFTCSVCPTVFGPQDSYYEHAGRVYCHFHYSTRFAVKCTGCKTAILKQFVEMNRNNVDEHWHPECYMIHKFWNIKLVPSRKSSGGNGNPAASSSSASPSLLPSATTPLPATLQASGGMTARDQEGALTTTTMTREPDPVDRAEMAEQSITNADYKLVERTETAQSLREKQKHIESQVYRIWTVLSTFEESSAACISEMLQHVSNGHFLDGVRMAEHFVAHVETLFAAIDDLNLAYRSVGGKEIPHVREARMLCKKVVNFFSLLSRTHESGAPKMSITQELLSLVTGLAHYLKILIRIALTAALKLERDYASRSALNHFLNRLDRLCKDPDNLKSPVQLHGHQTASLLPPEQQNSYHPAAAPSRVRSHGYKSLPRVGGTLIAHGSSLTDLCQNCHQTVEEECVRLGIAQRWHLACLSCSICHRGVVHPRDRDRDRQKDKDKEVDKEKTVEAAASNGSTELAGKTSPSKASPNALPLRDFRLEDLSHLHRNTKQAHQSSDSCAAHGRVVCSSCPSSAVLDGFEYATRLEQYSFLLCVALNKLYTLLQHRGVLPTIPTSPVGASPAQPAGIAATGDQHQHHQQQERSLYEAYRDSTEIKRMKSVNLDRKISKSAKVAQRLTIIESPAVRQAQPTDTSDVKDEDYIRLVQPPPSQQQQQAHPSSSMPSNNQQPSAQGSRNMLTVPASAERQDNHPGSSLTVSEEQDSGRPAYSRTTTAVRIREETTFPSMSRAPFSDAEPLGSELSPVHDEDGITLADLHQLVEAEQAREQHRPLPGRAGQTQLLSELSALEYLIVKHAAAITLASDIHPYREFAQLDELLDIIDVKKNNFWGKLFKGSGEKKKDVKKKGVFGVPLEVLVERHGADSMLGAGPGSLRVPMFVDDAVTAMKQMDMSVEGIFRKNGNIRRLNILAEAIDRDSDSVNLLDDNSVQIAALLKKFLRDLPDPLLTFRLQHLWLATQSIEDLEDRKQILHLVCCLMPKCHRDTMEVLFVFLKWVASFSHVDEETGSKMDLQNLATVICPNILYSKGKDPTKDESFLGIRAVAELLEYQDEFYTVPPILAPILHDQDLLVNPNELSSKDILKKAELYLRDAQRWKPDAGSYDHQAGYSIVHQNTYTSGHRGEVKFTHPHYHQPFQPSSQQNPHEHHHLHPNNTNNQHRLHPYDHHQNSSHNHAAPPHHHQHNDNSHNNSQHPHYRRGGPINQNSHSATSPSVQQRPVSFAAAPAR